MLTLSIDEHTGVAEVQVKCIMLDRLNEIVEVMHRCYHHPNYRFRMIWDLREVSLARLESEQISSLSLEMAGSVQRLRERMVSAGVTGRSCIVASDMLELGLSRMVQAYFASMDMQFRVFMGLEEARAWVGREPQPDG